MPKTLTYGLPAKLLLFDMLCTRRSMQVHSESMSGNELFFR